MQSPELDDPFYLLGLVAIELERRRTEARDLAAIEFMGDGAGIAVSTRMQPLADLYPDLSEILDDIGRTCRDEGIAVEQLRRITFFADEVNLEADDRHGGTDVFTWPIVPASLNS